MTLLISNPLTLWQMPPNARTNPPAPEPTSGASERSWPRSG